MSFKTPVELAHLLWQSVLSPGDRVLDATCGNGQDARVLADLCLEEGRGELHVLDIQKEAVMATSAHLKQNLRASLMSQVHSHHLCHSGLCEIPGTSFKLIVYNLGYLPGSDKLVITRTDTTLQSLNQALERLDMGGYLSIICYPGHAGGDEEAKAVKEWASALGSSFAVSLHTWINRSTRAPYLIWVEKKLKLPSKIG